MLHEQVMVLHLNISVWGAEKTDRTLSNEILDEYNSDHAAGKFIKSLLGGKCPLLNEIKSFAQTCRVQIRRMALPYKDGSMLVPSANFMEIMGKVSALEAEFNQKVEEFVREYPALLEAARLNSRLIHDHEVMTADQVRHKFKFDHYLEPLPTNNCFDGLLGDQESVLQDKLNSHINQIMDRGKSELRSRLRERIDATLSSLQNTKRQMDKRVSRNNLETIDIIRSLNITGDQSINIICDILEEVSNNWEALRDSIVDRGQSITTLNNLVQTYY